MAPDFVAILVNQHSQSPPAASQIGVVGPLEMTAAVPPCALLTAAAVAAAFPALSESAAAFPVPAAAAFPVAPESPARAAAPAASSAAPGSCDGFPQSLQDIRHGVLKYAGAQCTKPLLSTDFRSTVL